MIALTHGAALAASALAASLASGDGTLYTIEVLPSHLPTQPASAAALNDAGRAVGFGLESGWFEGAYWPGAGGVVNLNTAFGYESSGAYGINDLGVYVGSASFDASTTKDTIFLKEPGLPPRFLDQLVDDPLIQSFGVDITSSGLIAGACDTVPTVGLQGNPQRRAVLWDQEFPIDLGTLGGDVSQAVAVNESKLVVGVSNLTPGGLIRAFAWTPAGGMVQLPGFAPGARSVAADVNASGLIVGDADSASGRLPVTWPDLQTLVPLPLFPGDSYAETGGVNDHGQIVGRGRIATGFHARLWQNGEVLDLNALTDAPGLTITEAAGINDRGQILARAWDFDAVPAQPFTVILSPRCVTIYCTPKASSAGCVTSIATTDLASGPVSGAGDYAVTATSVQGGKAGVLFASSSGAAAIPFVDGVLCASPPLKRGPLVFSGGSGPASCDGAYGQVVNDGAVIPLGLDAGPGNSGWYQWWYRDPQNGPGQLGTALSNAVELGFE